MAEIIAIHHDAYGSAGTKLERQGLSSICSKTISNERGATLVEYAITTAILMALLIPVSFFITTAVEGRVRNAEQVHDGWCIPDPVDATLAAKCN